MNIVKRNNDRCVYNKYLPVCLRIRTVEVIIEVSRFIILGISLLLGVSYFSHTLGLNQSPSKMEGHLQELSQSVIENEKKIVKDELNAIKNKTKLAEKEANFVEKKPIAGKQKTYAVENKANSTKNKTDFVENKLNLVENKLNLVENKTSEKTRPTEQAQPVVVNNANKKQQPKDQSQPVVVNEMDMVRNVVADFGKKLQMVSLSAPQDLAAKSMRENYGVYLSATLLAKWQSDPQKALGRLVSSPWPDRIEIVKIEKTAATIYKISGEIIEITGAEKTNGGFAAKLPVILMVKKINNHWLIDEATAGPYETPRAVAPRAVAPRAVVYQNTRYGFNFSLPESWISYTIVTDKWEGVPNGGAQTIETGPEILIRHPQWTSQNPRQDIPIMIFTIAQWNALQQENFHIGAAPTGPSELGRNSSYLFALPARYNYAFPTGYEEVEQILQDKPLKTFEITD